MSKDRIKLNDKFKSHTDDALKQLDSDLSNTFAKGGAFAVGTDASGAGYAAAAQGAGMLLDMASPTDLGSKPDPGMAAAKGALKGAAMGAPIVPPIGAAVGAVVGGVVGFGGGKSAEKDFLRAEGKQSEVKSNAYLTEDTPEGYSSVDGGSQVVDTFAEGGPIGGVDEEPNVFNTGGTHEDNPLGGIPQGIGANGKQNLVEENEVSFMYNGKKLIISNRI